MTPPRGHAWLVGGVVVGSLLLAEGLVRFVLDPPRLYPPLEESAVAIADPTLGYALRPGASGQYTAGGRVTRIRVNERGFRDGPLSEVVRADERLLALGDSFTFGLGVDSGESWPEQLEEGLRRLGQRASVLNAGVPGYSMRQMRQLAEVLVPEVHPSVVLLGTYVDSYERMQWPTVLRGGQLVSSRVAPDLAVGTRGLYYSPITKWQWLRRLDLWLNQHIELGAHLLAVAYRMYGAYLRLSDHPPPQWETQVTYGEALRRLAPMLEEIRRTADVAATVGADAVVLLINPQYADGGFGEIDSVYNRVVTEFCDSAGIGVVDPLAALVSAAEGRPVYRTSDNSHWTGPAHQVAAAELVRHLSQRGAPGTRER